MATKLKVIGSFLLYVNDGYKRELRFFIETLRKVKCTVSRSPIGHRRGDCLSGKNKWIPHLNLRKIIFWKLTQINEVGFIKVSI